MHKKKHKYLNFNKFSQLLLKWNATENHRTMPWKGENDAYKIWLSEIILQQTRVEQGLAYYNRFIENFPTICDLSEADDQKIFKLWEGLGYYSRCKNLIATARYIHTERKGIFPNSYNEIIQLRGIGSYTAAAIASFAFNQPYAVVDGNVYRVLSRIFNIYDPIDTADGKKTFHQLAQELLDKNQAGTYNQSIMDFGATVCKPALPICNSCIFNSYCIAFSENSIAQLPVKSKKITIKSRYFYFFEIIVNEETVISERKKKDIWEHLFEFPLIELSDLDNVAIALKTAQSMGWIHSINEEMIISPVYTQKLTHQHIKAFFIKIYLSQKPKTFTQSQWVGLKDLQQYSFPKIINEYLRQAKR